VKPTVEPLSQDLADHLIWCFRASACAERQKNGQPRPSEKDTARLTSTCSLDQVSSVKLLTLEICVPILR
jgi:hypothetical protein